ncbi:MAG: TRAP transporter small permease subunit [Alphaproteobacteria bacterium]|nr:TRAP transporter small permease subunit [Alphaproteobacteria bacterium]
MVGRMNKATRRRVEVATSLAGAVVCAVYAWSTTFSVIEFYTRGLMIVRQWEIPQYLPHVAIPIGATFLTIEFLRRATRFASPNAAPPTSPLVG